MTFERNDGIWISDIDRDRIIQLCARYWDSFLSHCCSSIIYMYIRAVSSYSLWYLVSEIKVNLFHIWINWCNSSEPWIIYFRIRFVGILFYIKIKNIKTLLCLKSLRVNYFYDNAYITLTLSITNKRWWRLLRKRWRVLPSSNSSSFQRRCSHINPHQKHLLYIILWRQLYLTALVMTITQRVVCDDGAG